MGRTVTYAVVAGLIFAAQAGIEQWPVTSFRLFSQVRTDRSFGLELVAVEPDGDRERVSLTGGSQVVANAGHQLQLLRSDPPGTQRTKVLTWLELVGMDPSEYEKVNLERVERRLDPDGGPAEEVRRTVVAEVDL